LSIVIPGEPRYIELELETSEKNKIPNTQSHEIYPCEMNELKSIEPTQGKFLERRTGPTPIYNCHGMTFASRRTGISDPSVVFQILDDDRYVEISEDKVIPGDIILYFGELNDVEHSGIIVSAPRESPLKVAKVCSKWGKYYEGIHWANNVPYDYRYIKYYRVKRDDLYIS